jgi:hypothetical protein
VQGLPRVSSTFHGFWRDINLRGRLKNTFES